MSIAVIDTPPARSRTAAAGETQSETVRAGMARRLPPFLQPFLTWLTARPAPGERYLVRSPAYHVATAFLMLICGVAASLLLLRTGGAWWLLLPVALLLTTAGMGKLQAVVYHHCAHGTVFASRTANRLVGTAIGILLVVKHFERYRKEHMLHHSPRKLLTHEDEFADFVLGLAGLEPGLPKRELWRRVLLGFASPFFHLRFFLARISSCMLSRSTMHNIVAIGFWASVIAAVTVADAWLAFAVVWLIPAVVLYQIATALRALCEHRFPDETVIGTRDKRFQSLATAGVFAGSPVPTAAANTAEGLAAWTLWWIELLFVHLPARVVVLVGDAPCHDFHHRRPGSRRWASYIHEREADRTAGCPGFPVNYIESWGLIRAIDENLASLSATRALKS